MHQSNPAGLKIDDDSLLAQSSSSTRLAWIYGRRHAKSVVYGRNGRQWIWRTGSKVAGAAHCQTRAGADDEQDPCVIRTTDGTGNAGRAQSRLCEALGLPTGLGTCHPGSSFRKNGNSAAPSIHWRIYYVGFADRSNRPAKPEPYQQIGQGRRHGESVSRCRKSNDLR